MNDIEIYESLLVHDDARDRIIKALRLTVERQQEEIAAIRCDASKQIDKLERALKQVAN